jgi:hypothetical protein
MKVPDQRCTQSASKTRVNALMALHRVRDTPLNYFRAGSLNGGFMPSGSGARKVLSVIDTMA